MGSPFCVIGHYDSHAAIVSLYSTIASAAANETDEPIIQIAVRFFWCGLSFLSFMTEHNTVESKINATQIHRVIASPPIATSHNHQ
ncbi:hypothetical protein RKD55_001208 [Rossellomorea marisflavi]